MKRKAGGVGGKRQRGEKDSPRHAPNLPARDERDLLPTHPSFLSLSTHSELLAVECGGAASASTSAPSHLAPGGHWARALRRAAGAARDHAARIASAADLAALPGAGSAIVRVVATGLWARYPPGQVTADEERARRQAAVEAERTAIPAPAPQPTDDPPGPSGSAGPTPPPKRGRRAAPGAPPYAPAIGSAAYAFMVTLLQAHLEGAPSLTKAALLARAEASSLAHRPLTDGGLAGPADRARPFIPTGRGGRGGRGGAGGGGGGRGGPARFGGSWGSFRALLTRDPPYAAAWSSPLQCALTPAGAAVAAGLRSDAAARGSLPEGWEAAAGGGGGAAPSAPSALPPRQATPPPPPPSQRAASPAAPGSVIVLLSDDDEEEEEEEEDGEEGPTPPASPPPDENDAPDGTGDEDRPLAERLGLCAGAGGGTGRFPPRLGGGRVVLPWPRAPVAPPPPPPPALLPLLPLSQTAAPPPSPARPPRNPWVLASPARPRRPPAVPRRRPLLPPSFRPRLPPLSGPHVAFSEEYEIALVLDSREQYGAGAGAASSFSSAGVDRADAALATLAARGTRVEKRALVVGDALWVARRKACAPPLAGGWTHASSSEFALDLVIERKRADDLVHSLRSGRLARQRWGLARCGLRTGALLVEGDARVLMAGDASSGGHHHHHTAARAHKAVCSASAGAEVGDGLVVLRTAHAAETFRLYADLTAELEGLYGLLTEADGGGGGVGGAPPPPPPRSATTAPPLPCPPLSSPPATRRRTARSWRRRPPRAHRPCVTRGAWF